MIKLTNIEKYYYKKSKKEIHVLNNISLELPKKGLITITGPSGCGKTTLLNVLGMIDDFKSGKYYFDDLVFSKYKMDKFDKIRNEKIGFIFQNYNLNPDISVYENLELRLNLAGYFNKAENEELIDKALKSVGLFDCKKRIAKYLSGGQKQRVGIARSIIFNPDVILADEPTGNLDSKNTNEIIMLLKELSSDRLVVLVTHEKDIATIYSDRIILMEDGKIISDSENFSEYNFSNENDKFKFNPKNKSLKNIRTIKNHTAFLSALKRVFLNKRFFGKVFIFIMFILAFFSSFIVARFSSILSKDINYLRYNKNQIALLSKYDLRHPSKKATEKIQKLKEFRSFVSYSDILSMSDFRIFNYINPGITGGNQHDIRLLPNIYNSENIYLGRKPENDNEVVISSETANKILKNDDDDVNFYEKEKDLLNLTLYRKYRNNSYSYQSDEIPNYSLMKFKIVGIAKSNYQYIYFKNKDIYDVIKQNIDIYESTISKFMAYKNSHNPTNDKFVFSDFSSIFSTKFLPRLGDFSFKFYDLSGNLLNDDELNNLEFDEAFIRKEVFEEDKENGAYYTKNFLMPYALNKKIDGNLKLKGTFEVYDKNTNLPLKMTLGKYIFIVNSDFKNKLNDHIKLNYPTEIRDYGIRLRSNIFDSSSFIEIPKKYGYVFEVNDLNNAKLELSKSDLLNDFEIADPSKYFYSVYREIKILTAISSLSLFAIFSLLIAFTLFFMIRGSTISRGKEIMTMRLIGLRKKEISKVYFFEILSYFLFSFLPGFSIGSILIFNGKKATGFSNFFNISPYVYLLALVCVLALFILIGIIPLFLFLRRTPAKLQSKYEL